MQIFAITLAMSFLTFAKARPAVEEKVYADIREKGHATVILKFLGPTASDLVATYESSRSNANGQSADDLAMQLKSNADLHQATTLTFLEAQRLRKRFSYFDFHQVWALSVVIVNGVDGALLDELAELNDVTRIEADQDDLHLDWPNVSRNDQAPQDGSQSTQGFQTSPLESSCLLHPTEPPSPNKLYEWGVMDVGAPEVWERGFSGQGVVVGVIDSGIRPTHVSLVDRLVPEYGWLDAVEGKGMPEDVHGHGTHVAGIIAGSHGIGVAPNASLIACRIGDAVHGGLSLSQIMRCAQYMFCPRTKISDLNQTTFDCSTRPRIINNSWTISSLPYYKELVRLWRAVDQIVIFAMGNKGPSCGTRSTSAALPDVISVGASRFTLGGNYTVTEFSSRGPGFDMVTKPDFVAPGQHIISASNCSNSDYTRMHGTSMASPHVAGIAALLLSADPTLTQENIRELLRQGAENIYSAGNVCGGIPDTVFPNNAAGHGKVNALNSLRAGGYLRP